MLMQFILILEQVEIQGYILPQHRRVNLLCSYYQIQFIVSLCSIYDLTLQIVYFSDNA